MITASSSGEFAQLSSANPVSTSAAGGLESLLRARLEDLNGDGRSDLILTNAASGATAELFGNGANSFQSQLGADGLSYSANLTDLNADSYLDLALSIDQSGATALLLGDGGGNFLLTTAASQARPGNVLTASLGDLNGDEFVDLTLVNDANGAADYFEGDGTGHFTTPTVAGLPTYSADLLDLDADGRLDLAISNKDTGDVAFLQGDGAGHFSLPAPEPGTSFYAELRDLNGDNVPDLVLSDEGSGEANAFLGDGTGHFSSAELIGGDSYSADFLDVDSDGLFDLALSNDHSGAVALLLGDGTGHFTPAWSWTPPADDLAAAPSLAPDSGGAAEQPRLDEPATGQVAGSQRLWCESGVWL